MEQSKTNLQIKLDEVVRFFGTQKAAAEAAGIKQSSVNEWLSGKTKPSLRSLMRIEKKSKRKFKARELRPELFE